MLGSELGGRERLSRGQDRDRDELSLVSGDVLVFIYLGPSFGHFPLTDCVAFWRVECLGTWPTTSRPSLALGTSHMVLAISLASCPSIIASAARLAQVLKGTSIRFCPPPSSVPETKVVESHRREYRPGPATNVDTNLWMLGRGDRAAGRTAEARGCSPWRRSTFTCTWPWAMLEQTAGVAMV